jgi:toxin-antitoxin system PIN domain toxin
MTIIDANLLIYFYNEASTRHRRAATWLDSLINSTEQIGLPWITLWAFLRLSTSPRVLPRPLAPDEAFAIVRDWTEQPDVIVIHPGPRHAAILERLVTGTGARASMVTDAALAALAIENGATLASADYDFRRFPDLKWVNPLA